MSSASTFKGNDKLLFGLVMGVITFWLFYQTVFNLVPVILKDLNLLPTSLNAVIGIGSMFAGCFMVLAGGLADRFGRVRFTFVGFVINILACIILYFSNDVYSFAIGRIFQGLSAACIMPATLSIIKTYYHDAERQRAFSFWAMGSFGGSGLSAFVGGAMATSFGWKSIFILSIMVSIVGMLMVKGTPECKADEKVSKYDYVGLFSFVIGLFALNLLIAKAFQWGLTSHLTLGLMATLVVCAVIFFVISKRLKDKAFLDLSLFANRAFSGVCLSNFLVNFLIGVTLVSHTYLQKGRGLTSLQTGMFSLAFLLTIIVMIRVSEKLIKKLGYKKPIMIGLSMATLGVLFLTMNMLPISSYIVVAIMSSITIGFGLGFYATPAADCAMVNVPMDKAAVGAAVFKMTSALGTAIGISIASTLYTVFQTSMDIHSSAQFTYFVMAGFVALSVFVVMTMIPKDKKAEIAK